MLCVSIAPESATLAKVDLLNATRQADMVELCLDRLVKPPDVRDLLDGVAKPVIVSCRAPQSGGHWSGTEEDRLALLRQAAAAGPAYVELDPEAAKLVPRIGKARRMIAFTSLVKPLGGVAALIDQAANLGGEVVKFTWPTPTLDAAWPLLAAVSRKCALPVVGIGLGAAGRTYSLLGRKYGSPWIYAALERGMESHEGLPTVGELDEVYGWRGIGSQTRFVGVAGFGTARLTSVRLLNAAFKELDQPLRCLPLEIGDVGKLRPMLDQLQIAAVLTSRHLGGDILPLAQHAEEAARAGNNADLLLRRDDGWHAYSLIWRTTSRVLRRALRRAQGAEATLEGRHALVLGAGHLAQAILHGLQQAGATASVASSQHDQDEVTFCGECGSSVELEHNAVHKLAQQMTARYVPFDQVAETRPDVAIVTEPALELGYAAGRLNPAWLRPPMIVADLTRLPEETDLLAEARQRGCTVVRPSYIYAEEVAAQFHAITGEELPTGLFHEALGIGG